MRWVSGSGTGGTLRAFLGKGNSGRIQVMKKMRVAVVGLTVSFTLVLAQVVAQASSDKDKKKVEQRSTEKVDFPAGGKIYINKSFGEVSVEGWDQASVELIVTKAIKATDTPEKQAEAGARLTRV